MLSGVACKEGEVEVEKEFYLSAQMVTVMECGSDQSQSGQTA